MLGRLAARCLYLSAAIGLSQAYIEPFPDRTVKESVRFHQPEVYEVAFTKSQGEFQCPR